MTKHAADIRMLVSVESNRHAWGSDYFHVVARPMKMQWDESKGELMPFGSFYSEDPFYEHLQITAQGNVDAERSDRNPYGFSVEYVDVNVSLYKAEKMIKVLRKVGRGLDQMSRELEYPASFAQYLARVGKILGISQYGFRTEKPMTYSGTFQWWNANMLGHEINQRIDALLQRASV